MISAEDFYKSEFKIQDNKLISKLLSITKVEICKRGKIIVRENEIQTNISFLIEGVARGYYAGLNGQEITDCLQFRCGQSLMAALSLVQPSYMTMELLTESTILQFPMSELGELMHYPEVIEVYNRLLQESMVNHWVTKNILCQYTAMERYEWFLKEYPGLVDKIHNKYIASFLGMTPVTLSRLRRKRGETPKGAK